MFRITFWGGPKDGYILDNGTGLLAEVFTSAGDAPIISGTELRMMSQEEPILPGIFHRYCIDSLPDGKVVYKYEGTV